MLREAARGVTEADEKMAVPAGTAVTQRRNVTASMRLPSGSRMKAA